MEQIIANLGFPIACVVAMGGFVVYLIKEMMKRWDDMFSLFNQLVSSIDTIKKDIGDIKTDIQKFEDNRKGGEDVA